MYCVGMATKQKYQVAWSFKDNPDWIGHYDCAASSAPSAMKQARAYLLDTHGLTASQSIIREVYCI